MKTLLQLNASMFADGGQSSQLADASRKAAALADAHGAIERLTSRSAPEPLAA